METQMLEIDWPFMKRLFVVVVALMLTPLLVIAGEKFDDYLLRKFDERKARKTR